MDEQTKENVTLREQLKEAQDQLKAVTEIKEQLEQQCGQQLDQIVGQKEITAKETSDLQTLLQQAKAETEAVKK